MALDQYLNEQEIFLSTLSLRRATGTFTAFCVDYPKFLSTLSLRRATAGKGPAVKGYRNFYPRSPCGERLSLALYSPLPANFYPRSPCGERHCSNVGAWLYKNISIHALLAESDKGGRLKLYPPGIFLSTLSLRRATNTPLFLVILDNNFYPRSPCGERPRTGLTCGGGQNISIHALLAESDSILSKPVRQILIFLSTLSLRRATRTAQNAPLTTSISIHALLAESDQVLYWQSIQKAVFLSTLSLRRATIYLSVVAYSYYISIHALLAESDDSTPEEVETYEISIHALLAESDVDEIPYQCQIDQFLSTLSLRRATTMQIVVVIVYALFLSTLSLRRATATYPSSTPPKKYFYPRSPCGERPPVRDIIQWEGIFLSTLSLRRATRKGQSSRAGIGISIHALLAESDANWFDLWGWAEYFYPRSPCGERRDLMLS